MMPIIKPEKSLGTFTNDILNHEFENLSDGPRGRRRNTHSPLTSNLYHIRRKL